MIRRLLLTYIVWMAVGIFNRAEMYSKVELRSYLSLLESAQFLLYKGNESAVGDVLDNVLRDEIDKVEGILDLNPLVIGKLKR